MDFKDTPQVYNNIHNQYCAKQSKSGLRVNHSKILVLVLLNGNALETVKKWHKQVEHI